MARNKKRDWAAGAPRTKPEGWSASRVAKLRKKSGLSLRAAGEKAGVTHTALYDYENGRRFPSAEQAKRIMRVLEYYAAAGWSA